MMMKIKRDSISAYVLVNGGIHRPLPAIHRYVGVNSLTGQPFDSTSIERGPWVIDGNWRYVTGLTKFNEGDDVRVKNINNTPYSNVGGELWTTHGEAWEIIDGKAKRIPSEQCHATRQNLS